MFVLQAFGIIATCGFYFRCHKDGYDWSVEEQLWTFADLRLAELVQWRANHLSNVAAYQGNPSFAKLVESFLGNPADADTRRLWSLVAQFDKQEANRFWETVLMIGTFSFAAGAWFGFIVWQNRLSFFNRRVKDPVMLAESEMRFRTTFEPAATGIANTNLDGRWIRVNSQLCRIIGYPDEELLQKNFQEITHPEDLAFLKRLLAGEIQTYTMEKRFFRKDSSACWKIHAACHGWCVDCWHSMARWSMWKSLPSHSMIGEACPSNWSAGI